MCFKVESSWLKSLPFCFVLVRPRPPKSKQMFCLLFNRKTVSGSRPRKLFWQFFRHDFWYCSTSVHHSWICKRSWELSRVSWKIALLSSALFLSLGIKFLNFFLLIANPQALAFKWPIARKFWTKNDDFITILKVSNANEHPVLTSFSIARHLKSYQFCAIISSL